MLCLDFDGVLCDSIDECFVVGYNCYFDAGIAQPDQAPAALYHYFCRYRYLVGPAENFYLLFHAFEHGAPELERENFALLQAATVTARRGFETTFFERRRAQKQAGFAPWLALHSLYRESSAVLRTDFPDFYVVTTKDRASVEQLAAHHGYAGKLLGIHSKEQSSDKRILFQNLFQQTGVDPARQRVVFVDDNRAHLEQVKSLVRECYLAGWGYTGPAAEREFPVLTSLDQFISTKP